MASRELKVEIIGDASSLNKALGSVGNSSSKLGGALKSMGKLAAVGLGALGVGAAVAGKQMISMASDAAEVDSKLQVTFGKTLPGVTKEIEKFSEATGASKFAMREQAADMGALLVPLTANKKAAADMSTQFVELATDLGSFNNVPVADALLAIRSGLVGEAEPLRRFGVLLNEAAVNAEGVRMGLIKQGEVMTEQQKVQARGNLIMQQTSLAQGDATRTSDSFSNQMKRLKNSLTDAATEMGMKLLPAATSLVKSFNENWPQIERIVDQVMDALISGATQAAQAVQRNFGAIKTVAMTAFQGTLTVVRKLVDFFRSDFGQTVGVGVAAILAMKSAMGALGISIGGVGKALMILKGNPMWALLIPLGLLVGELAGNFIRAKIDAAQLASELSRASDNAKQLKDSLDALKQTELSERQAKHNLAEATAAVRDAQTAVNQAYKEHGASSAQAQAAVRALEGSLLNLEQANIDVSTATKAHVTAEQARSNELTNTERKVLNLTGSVEKFQGSSTAQAALLPKYAAAMKTLGDNSAQTAVKMRDIDPAASRAAAKGAFLADVAADLVVKLDRLPTRKEIIAEAKARNFPAFYASLNDLTGKMGDAADRAYTEGLNIGQNLGYGALTGIVRAKLAVIAAAIQMVIDAAAAARGAAESKSPSQLFARIGKDLVLGLAQGIGDNKEAKAKLKQLLSDPDILAKIGEASKTLGKTAVMEMIRGLVGLSPSFKAEAVKLIGDALTAAKTEAADKAKEIAAAIATAKESWASAFGSLAQAGMDAIAAKYAGWQPPSLLRAQREAEAREAAKLKADIVAAQNALGAALAAGAALPPLKMGEVPTEEFKKAEADILAARASLDDLLFQQRQAQLAKDAIQEQKDQDAKLAKEQGNFRKRLEAIMASHKNINAKVQKLLADFDLDYLLAGKKWGNALADGLRAALDDVKNAANELAQATADRLKPKKSPAKEGPLSKFDMEEAGRQFGEDWAKGMSKASRAAAGASDRVAGAAAGAFESAKGERKTRGAMGKEGTMAKAITEDEIQGDRPAWADQEIWGLLGRMTVAEGKWTELLNAVQSGSFKSNAGLLDQLFRRRTRWNWDDPMWSPRMRRMFELMSGDEGWSGRQVADYFGLMARGGIVKKDGYAYLHANEAVVPLPKGGMSGVNVTVNVAGYVGNERQLAQQLAPAFMEAMRRQQGNGSPSLTRMR